MAAPCTECLNCSELIQLRIDVAILKEHSVGSDRAVALALQAKKDQDVESEKKIEGLRTAVALCITRADYEPRHKELTDKIAEFGEFRSNVAGRESILRAAWAVCGALLGVVGMWFRSLRN